VELPPTTVAIVLGGQGSSMKTLSSLRCMPCVVPDRHLLYKEEQRDVNHLYVRAFDRLPFPSPSITTVSDWAISTDGTCTHWNVSLLRCNHHPALPPM